METVKQKTSATITRAAAPPLHAQRAAASVRPPSVRVSAPVVQPSLRVSSPSDPAEKEAESTARSVVRMSIPDRAIGFVRTAAGGVFRQIKGKKEDEDRDKLKLGAKPPKVARLGLPGEIQRKAEGMPNLKANVASEIQSASAGGNPLPLTVRRFMEPRFKADFSAVKVHTGDRAAKLNQQLNAKAFAVGKNVFFGKDQFKPETDEGRELIAHELTHTIQQGAATQGAPVRRSADVTVTQSSPVQVQRLGVSDALDYFADKANLIPGYRMFTIVLGVNPVNMSRVDRSPANIMRAIIEFIPGGGLITQALDNYGVFDKVGAWVDQQLKSLNMSGAAFRAAIMDFLGTLGWRDIFDLGGVWNRAKRILGEPVSQLISFAGGLVTGILGLIKDAILRPIAALAQGTRGYDLLKAILGRDPITGDPVPRNAETLIGGFMKLIGQEDVWENIKKGNAIPRAWAWFQGALSGLMSQVEAVPGKFMDAITSLTLADIVVLPRAFAKVGGVFLDIIGGFFSWAGGQVMKLLEIVFDVVSPGAMGYIKRVGGSLMSILRNPLPFVGNLVKAAKLGFQNFASRFGTHLKAGLIQWLTGSLPGIYIPTAFTLPELVKFVFSALGLTWANVRAKLVKAVGEPAVKAMETGFDIVMTLVTQGPAAAWEKIKDLLGNLRDMVIGGITDLVVDAVVKKAIPKLLAMFIPGAGFISAILSIYDTVMVFVSKISRIIQVVTGFINSIVAIAAGNIGAAATRVEGVLAGLLSLAISFLAGFAGLGKVSDKVMGIFNRLRAPIDKALDALITWIVTTAKKLFARVFAKKEDPNAKPDPEKQRKIDAAIVQLRAEEGRRKKGGKLALADAHAIAALIKSRAPVFSSFVAFDGGTHIKYRYTASPPLVIEGPEELPKHDVNESEIEVPPTVPKATAWDIVIFANLTETAGKRRQEWVLINVPMDPDLKIPISPPKPSMVIEGRVTIDGERKQLRLNGGSITEYALKLLIARYEAQFGNLTEIHGRLADDNKSLYQMAYARLRSQKVDEDAAREQAIMRTPFGKYRVKLNYTLEVTISNFEWARIPSLDPDPKRRFLVPTTIDVVARR
jgi:hypothetical protein